MVQLGQTHEIFASIHFMDWINIHNAQFDANQMMCGNYSQTNGQGVKSDHATTAASSLEHALYWTQNYTNLLSVTV